MGPMPFVKLHVSGHELGKQGRRQRIVDAAATILREEGVDCASVEEISRRARVSPATVYNLFGSKSGVFAHVFDADLRRFADLVAARVDAGPLGVFFEAIDVAVSLFEAQPAFYRALMRLGGCEGAFYASVSNPRIMSLPRLARNAKAAGVLRPDVDAGAVGSTLAILARGAVSCWAEERIDGDQLRRHLGLGFGLVLSAVVNEAQAREVTRRVSLLTLA